jgi:hypothetical protein
VNTGDAVGLGMPARDRVKWAKEMILDWIDGGINEWRENRLHMDADEADELLKQRNRVAKLFGFSERR